MPAPPLTNCHTHIFTSDHVPPFLGKNFLPFPLPYLLTTPLIVALSRFWFFGPYRWQFKPGYKKLQRALYHLKMIAARNIILKAVLWILAVLIWLQVLFALYQLLSLVTKPVGDSIFLRVFDWLSANGLLLKDPSPSLQAFLITLVILFMQSGRNLLLFILRAPFRFLRLLPGKQTYRYLLRYLAIGRFAMYKNQEDIFQRLKDQYPVETRLVVLPMDMEFMAAGRPKAPYRRQMEELVSIKRKHPDSFLPFVFIDPRRIQQQKDFFRYEVDRHGNVQLLDCDIKTYIETEKFSGFKIYPALGYYPFDELLLPLWKYAVQHDLPVLTHCIRGTIFYRGEKSKGWDTHPLFKQQIGDDILPMLLPQRKNSEFSANFTHPMNYLCLLKEFFLRQLVSAAADDRVRQIFGYTDAVTPLAHTLSGLKLCFGHYGGDDEWEKYFEADREIYTPHILHHPYGINFMANQHGAFSHEKIAQLWHSTDWYSLICSMMLQHPNVYSDISYIIHNPSIWPLLKDTLQRHPMPAGARRLSEGVLFGTDFYVVRNHKSEKQLLAEMEYNLSQENIDAIARVNPARFVK